MATSTESYQRIAYLGTWEWDVERDVIEGSEGHCRVFGLPKDSGPKPSALFLALAHPDDRSWLRQTIIQTFRDGDRLDLQHRIVLEGGVERSVHHSADVHRNADGRIVRIRGTTHDVTDLYQATEALSQSVSAVRRLHEIATSRGMNIGAKVAKILALGCETFGLPTGILSQISDDQYKVVASKTTTQGLEAGTILPLAETVGVETMERSEPVSFADAATSDWKQHPAFRGGNIAAYIGARVVVGDRAYGTLNFSGTARRVTPFAPLEQELVKLMAQWLGGEIERDQNIAALLTSEQRFRDFAEVISDRFWETGPDLTFSSVTDPRPGRGYPPPEDMIGQTRWEALGIDPEAEAWSREQQADMMARRTFRDHKVPVHDPQGRLRHWRIAGKPIFDDVGAFLGYRGTSSDETEDIEAREAAMEATDRFARAIEHISEGYALWDRDGRLVICNAEYRAVSGETAHSLIPGRSFEDHMRENLRLQQVPEAIGCEEAWLADRLARHGDPTGSSVVLRDGRWHEIREEHLPNGSTMTMTLDVTARREAEQQSQASMQQAERANHAKSRFLAAASHDLRQPLQALSLMMSLLADRQADPTGREIVADAQSALSIAQTLLDSLLDISKIDAGLVEPHFEPFAINRVLERLTAMLSPLAQEKRLAVTYVPTSAVIDSDEALIERILENLITNAIAYTKKGRILIGAQRRGAELSIEIWDTGIGIAAEQHEAIFEEFYQVDAQDRNREKGLGLGLAIVDRLAALLGHSVELASVPGRGTCFSITVPTSDAVVPQPELPASAGVDLSEHVALVVEDDELVLKTITRLVERWGMQTISAQSQREALAAIEDAETAPDVIIADYRLGATARGHLVLDELREKLGRAVPALLVTGDTALTDMQKLGASGYPVLYKPVEASVLRAAVEKLLSQ